jgi:hypothetical protein
MMECCSLVTVLVRFIQTLATEAVGWLRLRPVRIAILVPILVLGIIVAVKVQIPDALATALTNHAAGWAGFIDLIHRLGDCLGLLRSLSSVCLVITAVTHADLFG